MHIAVLGAGGQLGREICSRLSGEVAALTRQQADLTSADGMRAALTALRPELVINCAAYNFVDRAESEPDAACAVNAWGVRHLAGVCRDLDATLVHFSSDYVFGLDTSRQTPYSEADAPGPVNVYGISKLAGEYLVRAICPKHFVIRTCGLYGLWGTGGKGDNFVEKMLRKAEQGKPVPVVTDQVCTPSYAADVAEAALALINTGRHGLYHVTNAGLCRWYEFAAAIFRLAGVQADLTPTTSQAFAAAARRPGYSVMTSATVPPLRPWQEALAQYLSERRRK